MSSSYIHPDYPSERAQDLAAVISAGGSPAPLPCSASLKPGEHCYAEDPVQVEVYLPAPGAGAPRIEGVARRAKFRPVAEGVLHTTDRRFHVQTADGVEEIVFADVRGSELESRFVRLEQADRPAVRLLVRDPKSHYLVFQHAAAADLDITAILWHGLDVPTDVETSV